MSVAQIVVGGLLFGTGIGLIAAAIQGGGPRKPEQKQSMAAAKKEIKPVQVFKGQLGKLEKGNKMGVAGFVLGIISCALPLPGFGMFMAILAIIFSGVQKQRQSTGLATAGMALGIIGMIINFISIFLLFS